MGSKIKTIYKQAEASFNNPEQKKKWQGGIGIVVMVVFVLSSVLFNETVQAVNQAAGNYGYYSGSYGYQASRTTSDAPPAAPTSLSSTVTTSGATLSWTAPTATTTGTLIATGSGSISTYLIHYSTSARPSCSGGTEATSTSAGATLSSLSAATTYNVAICARDNNLNDSAALTGTFATAAAGGGGGGGGGTAPSVTPTAPVAAVPPPSVPPGGGAGLVATTAVSTFTGLDLTARGNVLTVATALGVNTAAAQAALPTATKTVETALVGSGKAFAKAADLGHLAKPLAALGASLTAQKGFLSTPARQESFHTSMAEVVTPAFLKAAAKDAKAAEAVLDANVRVLAGEKAIRTQELAEKSPQLNAIMEKREKGVIGDTIALLGKTPVKTNTLYPEWFDVAHRLAFPIPPGNAGTAEGIARSKKANVFVIAGLDKAPGAKAWRTGETKAREQFESVTELGALLAFKAVKQNKTLFTALSTGYRVATRFSDAVAASAWPLK